MDINHGSCCKKTTLVVPLTTQISVPGEVETKVGLIGIVFSGLVGGILEDQIGKRALRVSQTVSMIPEIRRELAAGDPAGVIQPLADGIRRTVGAEFVVVGDSNGIRYSHPNPDRLGKYMVGGDNAPALEDGRSYVSKAVGTLGPSLRGKTPVFDNSGGIIGIVSVGYLIEDVQHIIREHRKRGFFYIGIMLIVGIGGAVLIAKRFKKAIFGLEPEEVAPLRDALRGGIFDYILKPVIFSRFEESLGKYREYRSQLFRETRLDQSDVDKILRSDRKASLKNIDLPKGIDRLTLDKVRKIFDNPPDAGVSAEEAGDLVGVSRTTARRYLEYLVSAGDVFPDLVYRKVGRPERRYFQKKR